MTDRAAAIKATTEVSRVVEELLRENASLKRASEQRQELISGIASVLGCDPNLASIALRAAAVHRELSEMTKRAETAEQAEARCREMYGDAFHAALAKEDQLATVTAERDNNAEPMARIVDLPAKTSTRRCIKTSNPCGTDTWMAGYECKCAECQTWLGEYAPSVPAVPAHVAGGESDEWDDAKIDELLNRGSHMWLEVKSALVCMKRRNARIASLEAASTVTINGETMSTSEALRISRNNTWHAREALERLREELATLRARETDVAKRQRESDIAHRGHHSPMDWPLVTAPKGDRT
ncbi:MAG TPA: hypothetical protein VH062_02025 [Polyangiaceae bacterium]|jgi:hypothetical protein|nr:hypothetical protein [Polyangiaceae bacterium]